MGAARGSRAEDRRAGRELIHPYGVGLGFLATIGADAMLRLHPVWPVATAGRLMIFVVPSPKRGDLARGGRCALHAFTPEKVDDEFMVAGHARAVDDPVLRAAAVAARHIPVPDDHDLYELDIGRALLATYTHRWAMAAGLPAMAGAGRRRGEGRTEPDR